MSLRLPSRLDAWSALLRAEPPAWVLRHARCVESLAVAMSKRAVAQGLALDLDLIARGALLHDLGRAVTQDLRHAHIGADMVRAEGWPEPLACVVERHTGAGVLPDEARAAGLPARDYVPERLEERIVAHADNLYAGDKRQPLGAIESKYLARGLDGAWQRIDALHRALCDELDCELENLAPAELPDLF